MSLTHHHDRRAATVLGLVFALLHVYFFQGGGWNQNSQLDTIRAIVEQGSLEISSYASNTGDVGRFEGRVFALKAPGLAFVAAPFYLALYHGERALGFDPSDSWLVRVNAHALSFFASGLPGALLLVVLFYFFRREGAARGEAVLVAGAFGAGSLLLPYSTVLMNHSLTAFLLFGAWTILSGSRREPWRLAVAGGMAGLAIVVDLLALPAVALLAVYAVWRDSGARLRGSFPFLLAAALGAVALVAHNQLCFGSPWKTNYALERARVFTDEGDLLGVLGWPELRRLWWLSFHPFRGLFYCCPVLLVPLLSWRRLRGPAAAECWIPLAVVASFVAFNLSFNGWTGGWGVGPRYLIPALPFLYSLVLPGWRRFPRIAGSLAATSAAIMLVVTSVQLMVPGPNRGAPPSTNPVAQCFELLLEGRVSVSRQSVFERRPGVTEGDRWDSYNLGELAGLSGAWSLVPPLLLLGGLGAFGARRERHQPLDPRDGG